MREIQFSSVIGVANGLHAFWSSHIESGSPMLLLLLLLLLLFFFFFMVLLIICACDVDLPVLGGAMLKTND